MYIKLFNKMLVVTPLPLIMLTSSLNCQMVEKEEANEIQFIQEIRVADFKEIKPENQQEIIEEPKQYYSRSDLDLLARLIHAESGSEWMSDELQMSVGNVILNRVTDERFPDSIEKVIYQKGQYYCVKNGAINVPPTEREINNAKQLLEGKTVLPENVVWQSEFKQGKGIYKTYYDDVLGTTTYFCY